MSSWRAPNISCENDISVGQCSNNDNIEWFYCRNCDGRQIETNCCRCLWGNPGTQHSSVRCSTFWQTLRVTSLSPRSQNGHNNFSKVWLFTQQCNLFYNNEINVSRYFWSLLIHQSTIQDTYARLISRFCGNLLCQWLQNMNMHAICLFSPS